MPELVSILIPAYNAEKWIGETIRSAVNQTWANKEIIIVDDGSDDDTLNLARGFESKMVKVVAQRNMGASSARNTALKLAQGNYIQFLDADDLLAPDKISQQLKQKDHGPDSLTLLSAAWGRFLSCPVRAKFKPDSLWQDLDPIEWILRKFIDNKFMMNAAWLVSRRLAELAGPWDERLSMDDDGEYACRLVARSQAVKFVPEAKCYYRVGNLGSLSWMRSNKALSSLFLSISLSIDYLRCLEDSGRTRLACLKYLNDNFELFYPESAQLINNCYDLALNLGGELALPVERFRFAVLQNILGRKNAKKGRQTYNQSKIFALKIWEKLLHKLSKNCKFE